MATPDATHRLKWSLAPEVAIFGIRAPVFGIKNLNQNFNIFSEQPTERRQEGISRPWKAKTEFLITETGCSSSLSIPTWETRIDHTSNEASPTVCKHAHGSRMLDPSVTQCYTIYDSPSAENHTCRLQSARHPAAPHGTDLLGVFTLGLVWRSRLMFLHQFCCGEL